MGTVGIRELKQNASAVVSDAASSETVVIIDRGRPAAQLAPLPVAPPAALVASGGARPACRALQDLPEPVEWRSLVAIHLAETLQLGDDLDGMITFDEQLSAAAQRNGICSLSPR